MTRQRGRPSRLLCVLSGVALIVCGSAVSVGAAPVFTDGFESGNLASWTGGVNVVAEQGGANTGAWAARATASGSAAFAFRTFPGAYELWSSTWLNVESTSSTTWLVSYRKPGGTSILLVGVNKRGFLLTRNAVSKTSYTSDVRLPFGGWHELAVHIRIGSESRFDVALDGVPVSTLSRAVSLGSGPVGRFVIGDSNANRTFLASFDDVSVATDPGVSDTDPPQAPTGLRASATASGVDLTWQPSTDVSGIARYTVYRSSDGTIFDEIGSSETASFADTQVAPNTTYWWVVDAVDQAGNRSDRSEPATTTTSPDETAASQGVWSDPFELGVVGVHASVLRTGKVLAFYQTVSGERQAVLWDPASGSITDVSPPGTFQYNMFCSAHLTRPDGQVFVTGGTLWGAGNPNGTDQTAFFDPITETWSVGPNMASPRWYPTAVTLADGDALIFAGAVSSGVSATEVERYDAAGSTFTTLPSSATLEMATYPRMFLLPDERIVRVGQERQTLFFNPQDATWSPGPAMIGGSRTRGSVVLLPGLDRILALGGAVSAGAVASAEILEIGAIDSSWRSTTPMYEERRNFNAVLLPGGDVLVVGGNAGTGLYDQPVLGAELFDPTTETWTRMDSQQAPRAYHSTAVLLPDGRVLSSGQTNGTMSTTAEVFSPPYLFKGSRPAITTAPTDVAYGSAFRIGSAQANSIAEVALIGGGSVTHGVSFDQRYVELPFSVDGDGLLIDAPRSSSEAPPGWYMLFVVDDAGVPSIAEWVHVN